jgi:hypothetical protein
MIIKIASLQITGTDDVERTADIEVQHGDQIFTTPAFAFDEGQLSMDVKWECPLLIFLT